MKLTLGLDLRQVEPFQYGMESDGVHVEIVLHRKLSRSEYEALVGVLETQVDDEPTQGPGSVGAA